MATRNILLLCSARSYIGEAARVIDLSVALRELGHNVSVAGRRDYSVIAAAERRAIPNLPLHLESRFHPKLEYQDLCTLRKYLRENNIEILHAHRSKDHWLAALARRSFPHVPLLRTRHVLTPVRNHFANRILYGHLTHGVICVGEAVRQMFSESLPGCATPLRVILGGSGNEHLQPATTSSGAGLRQELAINETATVVSTLARPDEIKGHIHIIEALPTVLEKFPRTIFIFAYPRDNTYRQKLTARSQALRVEKSIRWLPPQESIGDILALTDIGLIASIGSEGWSRVAVEFLSAGIPTIATTVGSLPEIIKHEETGLHIPPRDPAATAQALLRLLGDEESRSRLGKKAREAAAHFSATRMATEVSGFYEHLLALKPKA